MSLHSEAQPPDCHSCEQEDAVALRLETKPRDVGGFTVRRVLPAAACRSVGPFVFFDEMGPANFSEGRGMDVRPHPHINLATVTYLFSGAVAHRDSLGTHQVIRPGAINLMVAGRGIVHSERSPDESRAEHERLHGLQLWMGLPEAHEEMAPAFFHHPSESIPESSVDGVRVRVLMGRAYGSESPVETFSETLYLEVRMLAGMRWQLPAHVDERALYLLDGEVRCGREVVDRPAMLVFARQDDVYVEAVRDSHFAVVGGEPLGKRFMFWNFVSSRRERIEQAKQDWKEERFPKVPGDEAERIALPA